MKVYIYHGDDFDNLEKNFLKFLEGVNDYKKINLKDDEKLINAFDEPLFSEKRLFIIDNIKLISDSLINRINGKRESQDLLAIYYLGTIRADLIKKISPVPIVYKYILPKEIYKFLELFFLKKGKVFNKLYKQVKITYPQELLVHFIFSYLKDLLNESYGLSALPDWKKHIMRKQLESISKNKLKSILQELTILDYQLKTGLSNSLSLDLYVYKNLE